MFLNLEIIGNIGKDAVVRDLNGQQSINFSVAHNDKFTNNEGVEVTKSTWINCTIWRKAGESTEIAKYLKAGTIVFVSGSPAAKVYKSEASNEYKADLSLKVRDVKLISAKKSEDENPQQNEQTTRIPESYFRNIDGPSDSDLPF